MASPKEVGLRVEDFMGINAQVSSEDLQDFFFKKTQNLYERKIGELQRRGGSTNLTATTLPSNITGFNGQGILYDKLLGKTKLLKVECTDLGATPINSSMDTTFVTDVANGKWGAGTVGITDAYIGAAEITLVGVGFGEYREILHTQTGSMPVSGDTKKLRVTISASLANSNITKIEIYAKVIYAYSGGNPVYDWMYVNSIDIATTPTGTFDFNNGPITLGADPGAPQEVGTTDTVYVPAPIAASGSLIVGKTYYFALMHQHLKYNGTLSNSRCLYTTATLGNVTITQGSDSIFFPKTSGGSACTLLAVGLHPQCLVPVGIISNGATFNYTLTALPSNPVAAVNVVRRDATTDDYYFKYTDMGRTEMFATISGSTWLPKPINNYAVYNKDVFNATPPWQLSSLKTVTTAAKYCVTQYFNLTQDMLYMVSRGTFNYGSVSSGSPQHNLVQFDGKVVSMCVMKYGSASPPPASYITNFKEKLVIAGGPGAAYNRNYFTNPFDAYDFGVPGAASTAQFLQVESGGEEVSGIGTYTNTTGTSGPIAQYITAKLHSVFVVTDLPVYTSGSLNNSVMTNLSRKVGCANHETIKNTEIGTIMTGEDNVWLLRESGEPVPLGHEISYFLRPEDPSQAVDTSSWNATVHDNRYKLSFSLNGSTTNSRELWLNIAKMKQLKGQPCWEGPHLGREVAFSMTEDRFSDTIIPKRICIDKANKRWYQADLESTVQDFSTDIATILETRDYPSGDPLYPKLWTATNWRLKSVASFNFTEDKITLSDSGGEETLSETRAAAPYVGWTGTAYSDFLNCRAKIHSYFPGSRIRGETMRLKWSYTGQVFFAISGMAMFFMQERRRSAT